jgi:hypothetical protein
MIALLIALTVALSPATPATPDEVTPPDYAGTWEWCGDRFPEDPNLAEACRWGAFEMTPATIQPTTEWRA